MVRTWRISPPLHLDDISLSGFSGYSCAFWRSRNLVQFIEVTSEGEMALTNSCWPAAEERKIRP